MVSIEDIAPARTFFGMSSGDSAVLNLGERPARHAEIREYFQTLRGLWDDGNAIHRDKTLNASWTGRPVPIYLAAEGPKTLELAGEVADGVIINAGLAPEFIAAAVDRLREGANRVGRDPSTIDIWTMVRVNVCDDVEAGIDEIKMELASNTHHAFRFTNEGKQLPDYLIDAVQRVQQAYKPAEHDYIGGANAKVIEHEPELLRYMAERFAAIGPPDTCVAKLRGVIDAGVTNLLFTGLVEDRAALIRTLGEQILPRLRAAAPQ
jgi:5,10-methylenetetrahydromethanopterin reductase